MARELNRFTLSVQSDELNRIQRIVVLYVIKDPTNPTYNERGLLDVTGLSPTQLAHLQEIIDVAQADVCVVEGLSCSSSSGGLG